MSEQTNKQNKPKKSPNQSGMSLQDRLYGALKEQRVKTRIYLANGFQLEGIIKDFDNFTILLVKDGKEQMIYKSAISTVQPTQAVYK